MIQGQTQTQTQTQKPSSRLVMTVGDNTRDEFAEVIQWLSARSRLLACHSADDCMKYLGVTADVRALVVWLQSYPGQFCAADLAKIRSVHPVPEMACVYGAISEGELRTGRPLPGIARIPWYTWESRMHALWQRPESHLGAITEKAGKLESPTAPRPLPANLVAGQPGGAVLGVASACQETAARIILACETAGHVGQWIDHDRMRLSPVDIAIWDDSSDPRHAMISIEALATAVTPAPIIATMSFPRVDDYRRLKRFGAHFVLGKPFMIEDLLWQIELLLGARQPVIAE